MRKARETERNERGQKEMRENRNKQERTVYYWLSRRNGDYSEYCMYVLCIVLETSVKIMCVKCVSRCCSFHGVPYLPRKNEVVVDIRTRRRPTAFSTRVDTSNILNRNILKKNIWGM